MITKRQRKQNAGRNVNETRAQKRERNASANETRAQKNENVNVKCENKREQRVVNVRADANKNA